VYARSTTIHADPTSIEAGIGYARDKVMPAVQAMTGCVGISLLVDRQSGRSIITSAWETEDAMRASENQVVPIRNRAAEMFGGSRVVDHWEIAALHRDHRSGDGACVRATWMKVDKAMIDGGIEMFRASVLPELEALEGFCSASLLVNRSTGHAVSSVTFDNRVAMERARERGDALKAEKSKEAGATEIDDGEFDLALAHLRVPELV
jgi:heme-degrading monooxygenase HmoA